jgi:hypothetical protein
MRPIAGTYGNITSDEYLHAQRIEHTADGLGVTWFDGSTITLPDGAPKIDLPAIPAAFRRNFWKRRTGGGAANSRTAMECRTCRPSGYRDTTCGGKELFAPETEPYLRVLRAATQFAVEPGPRYRPISSYGS